MATSSPSGAPDLSGQVIVITGGNSGIGKEAAVELSALGATVIITARDQAKGAAALDEVHRRSGTDRAEVMALDLADFASIRSFAAQVLEGHDRLDVLLNNAGGILSDRLITAQGFEMTFGVNHLGHFLLTDLLLDRLKADAPSRVITVTSIGHRFALGGLSFADLQSEHHYWSMDAYGKSKLANLLFTLELARRLEGTGVTSNALHPGVVRTGFGGADDTRGVERVTMVLSSPFSIDAQRGAKTLVYLASSPEVAGQTGGYYVRSKLHRPSKAARDPEAARRLWEVSEELIASVPA
jgi:NAD(P)-dependent dehydrogenase (short-subunit alcohol dehydrogenase family)